MATQKEVKNRIASVKNIHKITRAMEMVAAARLRRAEQRIAAMRPYAQAIRKMTQQVSEASATVPRIELLEERENVKNVGIILVTGDRGLAGAFNTNIIREGVRLKREFSGDGADTSFSVVGRRGTSSLTFRGENVADSYIGFTDRPAFTDAREISRDVVTAYRDEELDRVELVYNRYVSPLTQYVRRQTLLPLQQAEVFGEGIPEEEEAARPRARRGPREGVLGLRARARAAAADAVRGVRGPVGLPGAARIVGLGAGRADDRDALGGRERAGHDRRPDPGDEPGAAGRDHAGDP